MLTEPIPHLVLRADSGARVGIGHVMRCVALAEAWIERGGGATLLPGPVATPFRPRLTSRGLKLVDATGPAFGQQDVDHALEVLGAEQARSGVVPWFVLDGYGFGEEYHQAIRSAGFPLLVIDDAPRLTRYDADVVLDQNLGAEARPFPAPHTTLQLLGIRYLLLRREFRTDHEERRAPADGAHRLLVTLGGGETTSAVIRVLEALAKVQAVRFDVRVVLGPYVGEQALPEDGVGGTPHAITFIRAPERISELMHWADVAISAAGSTAWELAAVGVPMLLIRTARNQQVVAEALGRVGAAIDLGDLDRVSGVEIATALQELSGDRRRRERMSREARRLVDAAGTDRVVTVLRALRKPRLEAPDLSVREASEGDLLPTWRLANDPLVRTFSFGRPEIPLPAHRDWFRARLEDPDTRLLVIEVGGLLAAQVRYERTDNDLAEVHFAVAPAFRGRGLGSAVLSVTGPLACRELGVPRVRGLVIADNVASCRAFLRAGYSQVATTEERGHACQVYELSCGSH